MTIPKVPVAKSSPRATRRRRLVAVPVMEVPEDPKDCAEKFAADSPEEQMREREEDQQFNVDNDEDGCIAEESAEDATGMDGTPADTPEGEPAPEG